MKINRKQVILFMVVVALIGLILSIRRDNYTFTRDEVKTSLLKHVETEPEPKISYMGQVMNEIQIDDTLRKEITTEADKGDLADKKKLSDLIKKI